MRSRSEREAAGRRAETLAAWWLRLKGYRILARRARCARGEVDIIARRGRTLAFVEVKHRQSRDLAAWAVDRRSLARVVAAAEALAPRHARPGDSISIDAVLVTPGRLPSHWPNLWHG